MSEQKCQECMGTGYVGDIGPGIRGNREYTYCECEIGKAHSAVEDSTIDRLRSELAAKDAEIEKLAAKCARLEEVVSSFVHDHFSSEGAKVIWLPIETAPKDGTHIFVGWTQDSDSFGCNPDGSIATKATVAHWFVDAWYPSLCTIESDAVMPTHWMPVIPPPAKAKEVRE